MISIFKCFNLLVWYSAIKIGLNFLNVFPKVLPVILNFIRKIFYDLFSSIYNPTIEVKKANQIAYQKRLELEEKIRQASALKAAQKEIERMGYTEYGSGGGRDASLNLGPGGSYTGMGDVGATTANTTGDFATDSISYDLKDGGLATMFVERR